MSTNRFNQRASETYACCMDCDAVFPDREAMEDHQAQTMAEDQKRNGIPSRSHRASITNMTRPERTKNHIGDLIDVTFRLPEIGLRWSGMIHADIDLRDTTGERRTA